MAFEFKLIWTNLKIYWKSIFVIVYPLILLPVFLMNNTSAYRCLYVVLIMAGFWVFEALPLAITALIPMVLFPLMGILDSDKTSICYFKETNMMFVGGLIIAIAVEYCNLHRRMALHVIKIVGCSPRKLNIGLATVTMLVSMWISNTAAAAMMIPIVEATLMELEAQGVGKMWEPVPEGEEDAQADAEAASKAQAEARGEEWQQQKKPTNSTMCYFMSTGYAACIGGNGCVIGSGTNLTFKGIYESRFEDSPGVEFVKWLFLNVPLMLIIMYLTILWLQVWFMGLFRPKSEDAKSINLGKEGELAAKQVIISKIEEMGPMSFHEKAVGICFILVVLLWFFRKPQFIPGWAEMITQNKVKDATAALIVVFIMFFIPSNPEFIYMFSKNEEKRPKKASQGLITWKIIQQKVPWGLVFLLGGGFAVADASKASGMSKLIGDTLIKVTELSRIYVMMITCTSAAVITQFTGSNVAVANVILPVLSEMAVTAQIHPMYLMMPATLSCSFSYCLPVSTPPMAITAGACNMASSKMLKCGAGVVLVSLVTLFAVFPFLAPLIWDMEEFPDWAT